MPQRKGPARPRVGLTQPGRKQFDVSASNRVWVTDITYIRTHEGRLFLALVLDLFSREVMGWSMKPRMDCELALNALLMAVWRQQPQDTVMVHSYQGSRFSSCDWQEFWKANKLQPSMGRRGNCHDNAVAEIFFQLLKRVHPLADIQDREEAWRYIFRLHRIVLTTRSVVMVTATGFPR